MTSPIIVQRTLSSGLITTFGLDSLADVYANTVSGDRVIYEGGDIDLTTAGIKLKTGVNWVFIGNPTIASDSALGTFYDSNSAVTVHFSGDLTITNSNGLASRIILDNASSAISGFAWKYKAQITQASTSAPTVDILHENTLGGSPSWSYTGVGFYDLTLTGAFSANARVTTSFNDIVLNGINRLIGGYSNTTNTIGIVSYALDGSTATNGFANLEVSIEVAP